MSNVTIHMCKKPEHYYECDICQVFGVAPQGDLRGKTMPTRIIIRDVFLTEASKKNLENTDTDTNYTEIKTEVTIDRITSEAMPRPNERVPAGTIFGPVKIIHSLYTKHGTEHDNLLQGELNNIETVLKGMELLQDDYLGGSGSRGSGQIEFENLTMTFKSRECYENPDVKLITIGDENTDIATLRALDYKTPILNSISAE